MRRALRERAFAVILNAIGLFVERMKTNAKPLDMDFNTAGSGRM